MLILTSLCSRVFVLNLCCVVARSSASESALNLPKMGAQERIKEIEAEMARTQKNKATEYHLGRLKARLAILRGEIMREASAKKGSATEGFGTSQRTDYHVHQSTYVCVVSLMLLNVVFSLIHTHSDSHNCFLCSLIAPALLSLTFACALARPRRGCPLRRCPHLHDRFSLRR